MYYKVIHTAFVVICRETIPLAHIAITSALLFSETVTPLMLSVPRLLWPRHVNAHILHQSSSVQEAPPSATSRQKGKVAGRMLVPFTFVLLLKQELRPAQHVIKQKSHLHVLHT